MGCGVGGVRRGGWEVWHASLWELRAALDGVGGWAAAWTVPPPGGPSALNSRGRLAKAANDGRESPRVVCIPISTSPCGRATMPISDGAASNICP